MRGIRVTGEEALYEFYEKENGDHRLIGLVGLYMDYFNTMRNFIRTSLIRYRRCMSENEQDRQKVTKRAEESSIH